MNNLKKKAVKVKAEKVGEFYNISLVLSCGESVTLIEKSKRLPNQAQMFSSRANGNSNHDSIGRFFTFAKSTKATMYPRAKHLKSFHVELIESAI